MQGHKLSEVDKSTPEISSFFPLSEIQIEELDAVKDDYSKAQIDVRSILESVFMLYGRSLHHLDLFTMSTFTFPEYLQRHI